MLGGPAVQFGLTETALGGNCLSSCCFALCCPPCAAYVQRHAVATRTGAEKGGVAKSALLSCCCAPCVILQNANQMGQDATFPTKRLSALLKPPDRSEMVRIKEEVKKTVTADETPPLPPPPPPPPPPAAVKTAIPE